MNDSGNPFHGGDVVSTGPFIRLRVYAVDGFFLLCRSLSEGEGSTYPLQRVRFSDCRLISRAEGV